MKKTKVQRRMERYLESYNEALQFATERGYKVEPKGMGIFSFSKDGIKSVLGFDSKDEVLEFIKKNEPDPKKIFPPYK